MALFINEGMDQPRASKKLNCIAIEQMEILTSDCNLKRLERGLSMIDQAQLRKTKIYDEVKRRWRSK